MAEFSIPLDTLVFTSTYVTNDRMPILMVSHNDDEDGTSSWQFHCGNGDYDVEKMQLVTLGQILALDPTVSEVSHLEMEQMAVRESVGADWNIS